MLNISKKYIKRRKSNEKLTLPSINQIKIKDYSNLQSKIKEKYDGILLKVKEKHDDIIYNKHLKKSRKKEEFYNKLKT